MVTKEKSVYFHWEHFDTFAWRHQYITSSAFTNFLSGKCVRCSDGWSQIHRELLSNALKHRVNEKKHTVCGARDSLGHSTGSFNAMPVWTQINSWVTVYGSLQY